eukprot:TRINITY_DN5768_c0_g2_i1.p1 TRINITY_DN5768_c0_g2~~TRINITY_DN5768_c0_g2_i1.p1  ORF type:complete len:752 (-),score=169.46 TRINITY_DN5768_c0_g2_i1:65-2320(-)
MQKRFPAVKRYGLEGNESMMPGLDTIFSESAQSGVKEVVIGMPHRGRLNLLVGMLEYPAAHLIWKVKGNSELPQGTLGIGDVLSHIGQSSDLTFNQNKLHVTLLQNPSHLEAVDPVVMGKIRAKQQDNKEDTRGSSAMCVMLHGDASVTGQGIVTETLSLSKLPGFTTGGTIHMIVNNQIGFTTTPRDGRATRYSGDVGKFINIPILHVNSDSPEDVVRVCKIAVQYRNQFKKDIVIDLIGYRRHGHNEVDEPAFTQPLMYSVIRSKATITTTFLKRLQEEGVLAAGEGEAIAQAEHQRLDEEMKKTMTTSEYKYPPADHLKGKWTQLTQAKDITKSPQTGVDISILKNTATSSVTLPSNMSVHARLQKSHLTARLEKLNAGNTIDWATAEAMSVGSLLLEGFNVRISGQDVGRGTFSQRHWELHNSQTGEIYVPLNHMQAKQGKLEVVNSNLSELAVMGYEYGYSLESPNNLPIWEAQFGDFANGAQIIIDQFISSGESKWLRQTGLVLLLPHGYDGAGPEHSSSRIERFLQLCDGDVVQNDVIRAFKTGNPNSVPTSPNMYVINPSTPANYFHALRRQLHRNFRKPLIVISPKVLLRHPQALSSLEDMQNGTSFLEVIGDSTTSKAPQKVEKVTFCSGKIYYDLEQERSKLSDASSIALVRVEELSPFPYSQIEQQISLYSNAKTFTWVQEEQENAGAWGYVQPRFNRLLSQHSHSIQYIGRPPLSASAIGVSSWHKKEVDILTQHFFK